MNCGSSRDFFVRDFPIAAGGVVLVFATHGALSLHASAPIPHKVGGKSSANRSIGRDPDIGMTPLLQLDSWLARWMVALAHLSVD